MCLEVGLTGLGTALHRGQKESFFLSWAAADNEELWGSGSCSLPFWRHIGPHFVLSAGLSPPAAIP